ncbi:MAG TPA: trypsin-like serine protease, partial [Polyangia bacterium]
MRTEITRPIARWSYFQRRLAFAGALAALALGCGGERSDGVGTTGEKVGEIQGGTQEFGFPWVGAVIDSAGTLCTGSLISQNLVLTAGHCLTSNPRRFCTWADCRGVLNDSNSIAVDQAWNGIWGDTTSDTAILHLAKPIYNIAPGIITPGNPSPPPGPPWGVQPTSVYGIETGTICTAVGYGLHGGLSCQTGQCAVKYSGLEQIVAIGTGIASTYYQGIGVYNTTGLIDSGDSGGPLYCGAIAGIAIAKYPATGYPSEG